MLSPVKASANTGSYVIPYNTTNFGGVSDNGGNYYPTYYSQPPVIVNNNPAPTYSQTPTVYSGNGSQARSANTSKIVAKAPAKNTNTNALTANALDGSNSFMPSSVVQWIFFSILLLAIIILVRKILGAEKHYHGTPMKHA